MRCLGCVWLWFDRSLCSGFGVGFVFGCVAVGSRYSVIRWWWGCGTGYMVLVLAFAVALFVGCVVVARGVGLAGGYGVGGRGAGGV